MTMITPDRLHPADKVVVKIYEEGKLADTFTGAGFHDVAEAIHAAYRSTDRNADAIEDYVFEVDNAVTGTSARYRINAHGNVKLIV